MSETVNVLALKLKIIEAGISGKLVPQIAGEGTAEELLKQIEAERAALIKAGKIKKEKPLPEITEDEIPFDIPKSWKWVRINDLLIKDIKRGKAPKYTECSNTLVFAQKCNLKTGGINLKLAYYLDEQLLSKYPDNEYLQNGDILINSTGTGTLGRIGLFLESDRIKNLSVVPDTHITTVRTSKLILSKFLYYYLKNIQSDIEEMGEGSTNQKELKPITILQLVLPLPPLFEQKRIVAKIEELMAEIDNIERNQSAYAVNQNALKKKIIEAGITGKLVPQIASEGTADELLKQIEAERVELIKAGKLKKEKPLPEITGDEIPFEIPKSWKWVRFGNIIQLISGRDLVKNQYSDICEGIPYLTGASNIVNGKLAIERWTKNPEVIAEQGDILLSCKGTVGKVVILDLDKIHIARQIMAIRPFFGLDNNYLKTFTISLIDLLVEISQGLIPGISREDILYRMFPLPPLAEQKRIVAKIEELTEIIDRTER